MGPSPSPELAELDAEAASTLLEVARRSIRAGLDGHGPERPDLGDLPAVLAEPRGAFVTVLVDGELNGCIGTIEPMRPLAEVVATDAWSAAFRDPRLPSLRRSQLGGTEIEVTVLSELSPIDVGSIGELLSALHPGVDGLVIEDGHRRGVFLPQVWEQLPEPADFLARLQAKAGITVGSWPSGIRCQRFTVSHWSEPWDAAGT